MNKRSSDHSIWCDRAGVGPDHEPAVTELFVDDVFAGDAVHESMQHVGKRTPTVSWQTFVYDLRLIRTFGGRQASAGAPR